MAVTDETAAAAPAAPSAPIPKRWREEPRPRRFTVGALFRLLVLVALAAFLLYYVGPRDIAETAVKVVLVVVLTAALWVGANLLFDQAYDHWTRFNTHHRRRRPASSATSLPRPTGLFRSLFDKRVRFFGQGVFDDVTGWRTRPLDINGLLWGLIGGAALGAGHVPAQRSPPAGRPAPAGRAGVHRLRLPHGVRVRRVGVAADRLDQAVGLRRLPAPRCSG